MLAQHLLRSIIRCCSCGCRSSIRCCSCRCPKLQQMRKRMLEVMLPAPEEWRQQPLLWILLVIPDWSSSSICRCICCRIKQYLPLHLLQHPMAAAVAADSDPPGRIHICRAASAEGSCFFLGLRAEGYFVCCSSSSICSCRCCRPKHVSNCCSGRFYLREHLRLQLLMHGSIRRCTLVSFSEQCRRGL